MTLNNFNRIGNEQNFNDMFKKDFVTDSRDVPIPDMTEFRERRKGARAYPILLESEENKEKAYDVRAHGIAGDNYYHRVDNPPYFHSAPGSILELYVREGVLKRLLEANSILKEFGAELNLFDAYRPVEVQNYFHDVWVPKYLRELNPDWSEEKIAQETGKYWASGSPTVDAVDPLSPPPHTTGGVVDLTLRSLATQELLNMGSDFDEVREISFADHFEKIANERPLSEFERESQKNRRMLYWVMHEVGMVVNPNEWWHFGFGDQLSAKVSGAPHALYSVLKLG